MIESILFVCTGNLCRSPMAEALMRARLAGKGERFGVASAGLAARVGEPASPEAIELLARRGLDFAAHRARQITREIAVEHDLILVMDHQQHRELLQRWPVLRGRVHLLDDAPEAGDIPDPWGQPLEVYEQVLARIEPALEAWVSRVPA
jgi:protein-tyrosine phosphatase